MLLNELFKSPSQWEWTEITNDHVVGAFNIGSRVYDVYLSRHEVDPDYPDPSLSDYDFDYEGIDQVWRVEFGIEPTPGSKIEYGLTKTGNAAQVMATIIAMLRDFKSHQKGVIAFFFTAKEPSRQTAYAAIARRLSNNVQMVNSRYKAHQGYLVM